MTLRKNNLDFITYFGYVVIAVYIIGGNALTINFGRRLPLKLSEILSIIFIVLYILKHHSLRFKNHEKCVIAWLIGTAMTACVTFVIYKGISFINLIYGLSYTARIIMTLLTANFLHKCFRESNLLKSYIIDYILNLYLIVCIIGFFQLIFFPVARDFYNVFYRFGFYIANPDPHINRLISTYLDPNYLSACIVIPFAISFNQWKNGEKRKLLYVIIYVLTVILTVSRSGVLGICLVIMISMLKWRYSSKDIVIDIFILITLILVVAFMFANNTRVINRILNSSSDASTFSRIQSWNESIDIIKDNWMFGLGYNMIGAYRANVMGKAVSVSTGYGSDSSLLMIAISSGAVGVIYCLFLLVKLLTDKHYFKDDKEKTIIVQIILATLVITNFNNVLFYALWEFPIFLLFNIFAEDYNKIPL